MAMNGIADQYFTFESRLASFQTAQQLSKRRASTASTKGPKSLRWPHKFLSPEELAKAGFFYYPLQVNPDNVACFLCHKHLDGWEEDDDPLAEHLKHSPDCGWAICAAIERQEEEISSEYPLSVRLFEARKATFSDKWPHEGKKGWKCKVKQLVDAGWKYTPTPESDDMATCTYCALALDGWENSDKPMDEHIKRSADCLFFTLINEFKQQSPAVKRTKPKAKRDRTSKASRLSTQSTFTAASDAPSFVDLPAEEDDSILTTATNATAKRMTKAKKATAGKGRKTKTKKTEPIEVEVVPGPEEDDSEVKVDTELKPARGKKRKSDPEEQPSELAEIQAPPPKRRATRSRASTAIEDSSMQDVSHQAPIPIARKGRQSRKASAASVASLRAPVINDDEIDRQLQADLERPLTDDEAEVAPILPMKKPTRASKVNNPDHAMFGIHATEIDEVAIEAELDAMDIDSKPLPKAKGAKGKQPRKVSAKQQAAATKKAAEAEAQRLAEQQVETQRLAGEEAEAQRLAEEEASQQIAAELEQSISMQHSSPALQSKKKAPPQQPSKQPKGKGKATRSSMMSMPGGFDILEDDSKVDSDNDTDNSIASQSTVVRGGSNKRGSTLKKGKGGKKTASKIIEGIESNTQEPAQLVEEEARPARGKRILHVEEVSVTEETYYTPAPEAPPPPLEKPALRGVKTNTAKPRGRPGKASAPPATREAEPEVVADIEDEQGPPVPPHRSQTPPPKELTPTLSPQSSDAENHPPSSKPSAASKKTSTPQTTAKRIPLAPTTPGLSPSKRNVIAGLQSSLPWTSVDLEVIFMKSPSNAHPIDTQPSALAGALDKFKNGDLTSPERKMTVEEWIHHNAEMAEEKLRTECERMVGTFEREGTRAMRTLEGVECID